MQRVRRRLAGLVLVLAFTLGLASPLRAQAPSPPPDDVSVLTPPELPAPAPAIPDIAPPADLERFSGLRVVSVEVVVDDDRFGDVRKPDVTELGPGDRLSSDRVRRALDEALASGHYADARAVAREEEGGVRVEIRLRPRKIVDSVQTELHGAPIDASELLRDAELASEGELTSADLPRTQSHLEAILQRRGFPAPRVVVHTRSTNDPLRVVLVVDINVGAPRRIERRILYPIGGGRDAVVRAERTYAVKVGQRADETALMAADTELEASIRARGYHRAEVHHDVVLHRGIVVLRVRIDFGTRIETRYEGNDHFDAATLDELLSLDEETDRTPGHLAQKVRDFYVKHGFLDAEIGIEQRGDARDTLNYLVFHVAEGQRVRVVGRSYPCLREADVKKLDDAPSSAPAIGREIDSFLDEELPGGEVLTAPRASGVDRTIFGPVHARGARAEPLELEPNSVFVPETYERALQHVQELYRSEGYLAAQIGPVQVMRRQCHPRSRPGECVPVPSSVPASDACSYDPTGLPLAVPPLDPSQSCAPDRQRGITCEPLVVLRIPVKLGPRTQLYDVTFTGVKNLSPARLGEIADVKLGGFVSTVKLEEARRRVVDAYKEEGYAFADVKYALEQSPDRTRARVHFSVAEGEQVIVRQIVVRGNEATKTSTIARRVALVVGEPYRASNIRKTEERIATLGVFASVIVALDDPYVPQKSKTVIITVVERPRQYTEVRPGFSTGEGFRIFTEYGHRNLWGNAIQMTFSLQLAYIPTPLIIDPVARDNYRNLSLLARVGFRATAGVVFPEIGLGPLVRGGVDNLLVHDLQRDFFITKLAAIPNVNYRPISELSLSLFQSFELNNSRIFRQSGSEEFLRQVFQENPARARDLGRLLLVPDGETYAFSQRVLATWDRRDNAFNASRGTYVVSGIEHVDAYPLGERAQTAGNQTSGESHFFKFTQTFGGYIPLPKGLRIAALTRVGTNAQITADSKTYPDRLFFMGGVDSMRGWLLNSFIPQDDLDRILAERNKPDFVDDPNVPGDQLVPNIDKYTVNRRPIRGGDLMANERIELRIPIRGPVETVLFGDFGNLWIDPKYPFQTGRFPVRAAVGSGLRVQTPVGPLAVDYGINVTRRKPYEDFGAINFAIGLF